MRKAPHTFVKRFLSSFSHLWPLYHNLVKLYDRLYRKDDNNGKVCVRCGSKGSNGSVGQKTICYGLLQPELTICPQAIF